MSTAPAAIPRRPRRTPLYIHIAAWAVPVMILGQFALFAALPVMVLMIGTLADARIRALRWWAGLVTALYAVPLAIWLLRSDGAQSLSKDMHPVFVVLIIVASAVLLLKIATRRKR